MDSEVKALFAARDGEDSTASYEALVELFRLTEQPVDWAYDVWDQLVADLTSPDNHKRAFSAQMLSRLAISDPEGRILNDFPAVAHVMRDTKFVTARHTLQSLWRIGLAGPRQLSLTLHALETRFSECLGEKNASLIRTDTIASLANLANRIGPDQIEPLATTLIAQEPDPQAQKKQQATWHKTLG